MKDSDQGNHWYLTCLKTILNWLTLSIRTIKQYRLRSDSSCTIFEPFCSPFYEHLRGQTLQTFPKCKNSRVQASYLKMGDVLIKFSGFREKF